MLERLVCAGAGALKMGLGTKSGGRFIGSMGVGCVVRTVKLRSVE